jgi:Arc/MetJ family transcription regulator
MKTTINIDEKLLEEAAHLTGVKEKTTLVKLGLKSLIEKESAKRLAKLGGTDREINDIPRRRTKIGEK